MQQVVQEDLRVVVGHKAIKGLWALKSLCQHGVIRVDLTVHRMGLLEPKREHGTHSLSGRVLG